MNRGLVKLSILALSVYVRVEDEILTLSKSNDNKLHLLLLNPLENYSLEVATFDGSKGFILGEARDKLFISVDDKLLIRNDYNSWRTVLKCRNPRNFFWHMAASRGVVYVQEYGNNPCGIYASEDLERWRLLITSRNIDKRARHFHSVAYDPYRDMLIATLGDGNYAKVAVSCDGGDSWRPVYTGAWQSVPIVILKDHIVFGMDSAMSSGVLIWRPEGNRWTDIHLRWRGSSARFIQMADLRFLDNGIWISALGTPQALIASRELKNWYPIYVESFDQAFNHAMSLGEGKNIIALATGKIMIVAEKELLAEQAEKTDPIAHEHEAIHEKLIGLANVLKRKIIHSLKF